MLNFSKTMTYRPVGRKIHGRQTILFNAVMMYFMILSVHRGSVLVEFMDQHCPFATGYCENIVKLQRSEIRFAKKNYNKMF